MTTSMRFESSEASMPSHLVGFSLAFTPVCSASALAKSTSKPVSLPSSPEAERRIGAFRADDQRAALLHLLQQIVGSVGLGRQTGGQRDAHHAQQPLTTNFCKHHKHPCVLFIF